MTVCPVLVVSSINKDTSLILSTFPSAGETVIASGVGSSLGGKGANVAVAAARSGLVQSRLCGAIGEDGRDLLQVLTKSGVDTSLVSVLAETNTGAAYILLEEDGGNRIVVAAGANLKFKPPANLSSEMRRSVVVLQLEIDLEASKRVAIEAKQVGATVVFNPSPVPKSSDLFGPNDKVWACVDVVVMNEIEIGQLTGVPEDQTEKAMRKLREWCTSTTRIVVTLGSKGVMFLDGDKVQLVPAVFVDNVVDTTGAGDTFTGYLAAGIAAGREFERCIREAVVAAAICVGREGAANAIPTGEEVLEWLGAK